MSKLLLESAFNRLNEISGHIVGQALNPRVSRNLIFYTPAEMQKADGRQVPLNWEHDPNQKIGYVTFHYDKEKMNLNYDGYVTDQAKLELIKNKQMQVSIEADSDGFVPTCDNVGANCFNRPYGVTFTALGVVETPGIPESSLSIIESFKEVKTTTEPFGGYKNFDACIAANGCKSDPQGYCATIMRKTEDVKTDTPVSGVTMYKCKLCGSNFKSKENLMKYVYVKHVYEDVIPKCPIDQIMEDSMPECPKGQQWDADEGKCIPIDPTDIEQAPDAVAPDSDFAYVPKDGTPSDRKLPINDAAHTRNALARFDQTQLPAGEKTQVLAKICSAAKKFGIDSPICKNKESVEELENKIKKLEDKLTQALTCSTCGGMKRKI